MQSGKVQRGQPRITVPADASAPASNAVVAPAPLQVGLAPTQARTRPDPGLQAPTVGRPAAPKAVAEALPKKADAKFDYVVVGAGGAGAVTAARLAESGYKVLVLEGGDDKKVVASEVPVAHAIASEHPDLAVGGSGYFVDHFSDPARQRQDPKYVEAKGGIFYPRGEGIGGSTRMNAMIFVRPDDVDWDNIAKVTGDPSWSAKNMQQYMNKLEKNRYRPVLRLLHEVGKRTGIEGLQNIGGHGFDGWLETTRADPKLLLQDKQLLRMVWETTKFSFKELGSVGDKLKRLVTLFDPNDTLNQGNEGLTLTPTSITKTGRRNGPRDRLLAVQERLPDNVEIRTGAKVDKVLLDENNVAVGVQYTGPDGKTHVEATGREVLLSAGAFESPAVLLRSGIGSQEALDTLKPMGVEPKVVRAGVGKSLSDRYEYGLVFRLKQPLDLVKDLALSFDDKDAVFKKWQAEGGTAYATNGAIVAFQAKSDPSLSDPDLYFFLVPGKFAGYEPGYSAEAASDPNLATLVILDENKRDKHGTVQVDPKHPSGQPRINFQYHEEETSAWDDRLPLARGVQMGRELIARFGDLVEQEVLPGPKAQTLEQIAEEVGKASWGHHANGTAKMGRADDPDAVVDSKFNVIGTQGLRVIDASTFPSTPGSFIVSAVMLQAEKAADDVLKAAALEDAARAMPVSQRQ
ncbi:MAG: GMC family oxidoreductase N-terminal domain-containing protein [Myxococcales bacterium]|nr:GMC family oxidoreductase N-terminal domain-containing protein [Myxococcales bacterium]